MTYLLIHQFNLNPCHICHNFPTIGFPSHQAFPLPHNLSNLSLYHYNFCISIPELTYFLHQHQYLGSSLVCINYHALLIKHLIYNIHMWSTPQGGHYKFLIHPLITYASPRKNITFMHKKRKHFIQNHSNGRNHYPRGSLIAP